jgi:hypothetical protein
MIDRDERLRESEDSDVDDDDEEEETETEARGEGGGAWDQNEEEQEGQERGEDGGRPEDQIIDREQVLLDLESDDDSSEESLQSAFGRLTELMRENENWDPWGWYDTISRCSEEQFDLLLETARGSARTKVEIDLAMLDEDVWAARIVRLIGAFPRLQGICVGTYTSFGDHDAEATDKMLEVLAQPAPAAPTLSSLGLMFKCPYSSRRLVGILERQRQTLEVLSIFHWDETTFSGIADEGALYRSFGSFPRLHTLEMQVYPSPLAPALLSGLAAATSLRVLEIELFDWVSSTESRGAPGTAQAIVNSLAALVSGSTGLRRLEFTDSDGSGLVSSRHDQYYDASILLVAAANSTSLRELVLGSVRLSKNNDLLRNLNHHPRPGNVSVAELCLDNCILAKAAFGILGRFAGATSVSFVGCRLKKGPWISKERVWSTLLRRLAGLEYLTVSATSLLSPAPGLSSILRCMDMPSLSHASSKLKSLSLDLTCRHQAGLSSFGALTDLMLSYGGLMKLRLHSMDPLEFVLTSLERTESVTGFEIAFVRETAVTAAVFSRLLRSVRANKSLRRFCCTLCIDTSAGNDIDRSLSDCATSLVYLLRDNRNLNSIGFNLTLGNHRAILAAAAAAAAAGVAAGAAAGVVVAGGAAAVAAAAVAAAAAFLLPALAEGLRHNSCVEKVDLQCGSDGDSGARQPSYVGPAAVALVEALRERNTVLKWLEGINFAPAERDTDIRRLLQLNRSGRHFLLRPDQATPERMPRILAKIGSDAGAAGVHHFLSHMARERLARLTSGLGRRRTEAAAALGPPDNDGDE